MSKAPHDCNCPDCPERKRKELDNTPIAPLDWWPDQPVPQGCNCNDPLWMVIPPEGTWLYCPVHGARFVRGTQITW